MTVLCKTKFFCLLHLVLNFATLLTQTHIHTQGQVDKPEEFWYQIVFFFFFLPFSLSTESHSQRNLLTLNYTEKTNVFGPCLPRLSRVTNTFTTGRGQYLKCRFPPLMRRIIRWVEFFYFWFQFNTEFKWPCIMTNSIHCLQ